MNNLSSIGKTPKQSSWIKYLRTLLLNLMSFFLPSSLQMSRKMKKDTNSKNAMNINQLMVDDLRRPNFLPHEFFVSETARRLGIENSTDDISILASLNVVADKMQEIRDAIGLPITITSAYRCPDLNKAVGSKDTSQHLKGQAVDFQCHRFGTAEDIVVFIKEKGIEVDQVLVEQGWVHLSIKLNDNRNEFATLIDGIFKIIA